MKEKLKKLLIECLKYIAGAIAALLTAWGTSCTTAHTVTQSSTSESTVRGDTTVTSVKITYEQIGKMQK